MRYLRLSHAAVALEDSRPLPPVKNIEPWQIRWATNAMRTPLGTCVALQLREGRVWVGVRAPALTWKPVEAVLTRGQAEAWIQRAGFTR